MRKCCASSETSSENVNLVLAKVIVALLLAQDILGSANCRAVWPLLAGCVCNTVLALQERESAALSVFALV